MRIDPHELYWAIIRDMDRKADRDTLRFAFERVLPLPVDEVECRFVFDPEHSVWIACGIEHDELIARFGEHASSIESVRPSALPDFLERVGSFAPAGFEFRSGRYASPSRLRHRRRVTRTAIAAVVAMSFIVSLGFTVSAGRLTESARAVNQATQTELGRALESMGLSDQHAHSAVQPSLVLTSQLRKAERSRTPMADGNDSLIQQSTAPQYVALLASWPGGVRAAVESVQVGSASISINGSLADAEDWERLRATLSDGLPGWPEQSASINRADDRFRFSLRFERRAKVQQP